MILHPLHASAFDRVAVVLILATALMRVGPTIAAEFNLPPRGTDVVGEVRIVISRQQDTLLDIARKHDLGFNEITAANPSVDPWLPGEGTRVVLPTQFVLPPGPREGIVINLAQLRLYYFPAAAAGHPRSVQTHPIGIGVDYSSTPLGTTRVLRKAVDPVWYPPAQIREERAQDSKPLPRVVPAGPDNPLGKYALYLGFSGYLIHGTNRPWGIGMRVSHGCIRMNPEDIESLHRLVPVGTPVRIVDEPYFVGALGGTAYLQAFRTPDAPAEENLTPLVRTILQAMPRQAKVDWNKATSVASAKRGIPVPLSAGTSGMDEILANARRVDDGNGEGQ
jgi:L,D-transpeptidase ErfK/SrfK